jgi:hypothetical protein
MSFTRFPVVVSLMYTSKASFPSAAVVISMFLAAGNISNIFWRIMMFIELSSTIKITSVRAMFPLD